jgi:proliferating cell nuclear antigen
MQATFANGIEFRQIIESIRELVDDVNINVNEKGWSLQQMDSSMTTMVNLELNKGFFESYSCVRNHCIGIRLPSLLRVLRPLTAGESLTLSTRPGSDHQVDKMKIHYGDKEFTLKLLEMDLAQLGMPDAEPAFTIRIDHDYWIKSLKDIYAVGGPNILLAMRPGEIHLRCEGDIGEVKSTIRNGEKAEITVKSGVETTDWIFSAMLILKLNVTKIAKAKGMCTIRLYERPRGFLLNGMKMEAAPIQITFDYTNPNSNTVNGKLEYFLAPKVEED